MKQFLLPYPPDSSGMIRLKGKDFHYLARVRRFKPGMAFTARLPTGETVAVEVQSVEAGCLTGVCGVFLPQTPASSAQTPACSTPTPASSAAGSACSTEAAASPDSGSAVTVEVSACSAQAQASPSPMSAKTTPLVVLLQGLPKLPKMDVIIRQAVELGIDEVVPFTAAYSVVPAGREKTARWNRIVKEARQQSGSPVATAVSAPCTLTDVLNRWAGLRKAYSPAAGIVLHQDPLESGGFHRYLAPIPAVIAVAVGPEGGFAPAEIRRFRDAGFSPLTLGTPILRTETAALVAAAAVRIILLESESWSLRTP